MKGIDMRDMPSTKEKTLYEIGDKVRYKHHTIKGVRTGEIVWKNLVDEESIEYQVDNFNWLLWEDDIIEKVK